MAPLKFAWPRNVGSEKRRETSYVKLVSGGGLILFALLGFLVVASKAHSDSRIDPVFPGVVYAVFLVCGLLLLVFRFKREPARPAGDARSDNDLRFAPDSEPGAAELADWQRVFEEFVAIKRRCGEDATLTFDKFKGTLRRNKEHMQRHCGCPTVKFTVYKLEGKAALKASPVKTEWAVASESNAAIGVRFDIGKVDDSGCGYGEACWRVFWQAVDKRLVAGAALRDGDTDATPDRENVYCLSMTWSDGSAGQANKVRQALEDSDLFLSIAADPRFVGAEELRREPLVDEGAIDRSGSFVGTSYRALAALEAVRKKVQESAQVAMSGGDAPAAISANSSVGTPSPRQSPDTMSAAAPSTPVSDTRSVVCPKCNSSVIALPKGTDGGSDTKGFVCPGCSWSARKCGNRKCSGHTTAQATPVGYQHTCSLCGWTGFGNAFDPKKFGY